MKITSSLWIELIYNQYEGREYLIEQNIEEVLIKFFSEKDRDENFYFDVDKEDLENLNNYFEGFNVNRMYKDLKKMQKRIGEFKDDFNMFLFTGK